MLNTIKRSFDKKTEYKVVNKLLNNVNKWYFWTIRFQNNDNDILINFWVLIWLV